MAGKMIMLAIPLTWVSNPKSPELRFVFGAILDPCAGNL